MNDLLQDLRYALRLLIKTPAFTAVALLTLALGIGANAAIFSIVDGVMLRPLPYPEVQRIMLLNEAGREGGEISISWQNFQDWLTGNRTFEHLGVYRRTSVSLTGGDRPERLKGSMASAAVFRSLGMQPLLGRVFGDDEDRAGSGRVAIISEGLWRSRFGADPAIVGRDVPLDGQGVTIIGVMPEPFRFPARDTDVWVPLGPEVAGFPTDRGNHPGLYAVGRVKAGVGFEQTRADMQALADRLSSAYPDSNKYNTIAVVPLYEELVREVRPALLMLLGAVAFVLFIGCANLANLMLARADGRQREIAVRAALGAGKARIVRQLLTESVLLSLAGGALGILLARSAIQMLVAAGPASIPRLDQVAIDWRVLAFTTIVASATGIIFGLVPALRASSLDLNTTLKEASRGSTSGSARRLRGLLVVSEVALAFVLLIGAGLMMKSFDRLVAIDPGFKVEHVLTMRVALPEAKYPGREEWTNFHRELLRRISSLSGVEAAGINNGLPLEGDGSESGVLIEGRPMPAPDSPGTECLFQAVSPDYFGAMGMTLIKGRTFTDRDREGSTAVAIVDDWIVKTHFPNQDPIGKRLAFEFLGHSLQDPRPIWREIVGVVRHVEHYGLGVPSKRVQIYAPYEQLPLWLQDRRPAMALVVRTAIQPNAMVKTIQGELASLDRDLPIYNVETMEEYFAENVAQPRFSMLLLGVFSGLALALAVIGIYGVLSYSVTQRTQEIGIRMSLGATRGAVMRLVLGYGMTLAAAGVAIGMIAALGVSRLLSSLLYQVSPTDPMVFGVITIVLACVAAGACYLPGRRATLVNPIDALRQE